MKKSITVLIIYLAGLIPAMAQNYFDKMGNITQAEVDMTSCSYDPTADAVVLFDVGESSFYRTDNGFDVFYRRITRIKILNEAGKRYAEVSIPYYQEGSIFEIVDIKEATTYNKTNGVALKTTKLNPKATYVEKGENNWKHKKFAIPDVQVGSIIEYVYTISSQYHFNLRDWEFQWSIPVLYSHYETRMIPFYEYTWLLQGRSKLDEYESYEDHEMIEQQYNLVTFSDMVYKFGLKNVPAFNDEEFLTSREDHIIKINFQLSAVYPSNGGKIEIMSTWPKLINDYLKHEDFGKYVKKCGNNSVSILNKDSLAGRTELQKFNYIVDFAKANFKWDNENYQFSNKTAGNLIKDKQGNSSAINLWVVGALQEAKIEAFPVLLSTRKHGKIISDFPFVSAFNTTAVLAIVDNKPILTDATITLSLNNRLPAHYINDKGLVIDKENVKWVSLQSQAISLGNTYIMIDSIGKDFSATVTHSLTEYEALNARNSYGDDPKKILAALNKKMYQVADDAITIKNAFDRNQPYIYSFKLNPKTEIINNKIYIQPFLNEILAANPLKQKTRNYPIDFNYPVSQAYTSKVIIPEGYKVYFLPENIKLNDELFELNYSVVQNDQMVSISFSYSFKSTIYPPETYHRVKSMFDKIVQKGADKIVLIKK